MGLIHLQTQNQFHYIDCLNTLTQHQTKEVLYNGGSTLKIGQESIKIGEAKDYPYMSISGLKVINGDNTFFYELKLKNNSAFYLKGTKYKFGFLGTMLRYDYDKDVFVVETNGELTSLILEY